MHGELRVRLTVIATFFRLHDRPLDHVKRRFRSRSAVGEATQPPVLRWQDGDLDSDEDHGRHRGPVRRERERDHAGRPGELRAASRRWADPRRATWIVR